MQLAVLASCLWRRSLPPQELQAKGSSWCKEAERGCTPVQNGGAGQHTGVTEDVSAAVAVKRKLTWVGGVEEQDAGQGKADLEVQNGPHALCKQPFLG